MKSLRTFDRRLGNLAAALALLVGLAAPSLVPAFASAAQLTERSVELSSSAKSAEDVSYKVTFTSATNAAATIVQFCKNSPLIGTACVVPDDMDLTSADTDTSGATLTVVDDTDDNIVKVVKATGTSAFTFNINDVDNPSIAGPIYARILTYASSGDADEYTAGDDIGTPVDQGSAAIAITNEIGVTAAVLESMTFCVASVTITANCGDAATQGHEPSLNIGESSGGVVALSSTATSTKSLFTQISTNAAGGAVVNLKSNAKQCGGLLRSGSALGVCDIKPADGTDVILPLSGGGTAAFGVKTATASGVSGGTGTLQARAPYNSSSYYMGFDDDEETGVTSTYGDPILDTDSKPLNNMQMELTFGASIANNTPAGRYTANLSMIATGKF